MTAALSSNFTRVPSGRRIGLRWRMITASSTCRRISGVPLVTVSVTKGTPEMRRQVLEAVIIRQRKPIRRPDGTRVKFEDNAAVVVDENEDPRGTELKGPIAREVAERFGTIASAATMIV